MFPAVVPVQAEIDLHERPHFGRFGLRMRCSPASCGVRLAFLVLHSTHEQTMFSHDRRTAAVARGDVIQIQILPVERRPQY